MRRIYSEKIEWSLSKRAERKEGLGFGKNNNKFMDTKSTIINIDKIYDIFKEYYGKMNKKFNKNEFQKFLDFLEIDFYDWVKENLNQFYKQK